jgi:tetratricopeptide (TPR) repeat protein
MPRSTFFSLILSILLFGLSVGAAETRPLSQDEVVQLLSDQRYRELDARLTAAQSNYKKAVIDDVQLREVFRAFYLTDPALAKRFDEWVEQFPKSYVARLARGIYWKKIGQERRGPQSASATTREQFKGMEAAFAKAIKDFQASLALDDQPLLSFLHEITIYKLQGRGEWGRSLMDRAIKLDKDNYVVRYAYMDALQSPWGGDVEVMKAFLEECREAKLSGPQLRSLEALVAQDQGWTYRYREGDGAAAARAYITAAQFDPEGTCRYCDPIQHAADALFDEADYAGAIKLYSRVLDTNPNALYPLSRRAFSALQVGDAMSAVKDLTHAAKLEDAYAQDLLGRMYLLGTSITKDRTKAVEWLRKAAAQGYKPSQELLPIAMDPKYDVQPLPGGPRL